MDQADALNSAGLAYIDAHLKLTRMSQLQPGFAG